MGIAPEYQNKVAELEEFLKGSILGGLGLRITVARDGFFEFQFEVTPNLLQPAGLLNGGVTAMIAESAASTAMRLTFQDQSSWVGSELIAHHLRSVSSGIVTTSTTPLHLGRRTALWKIDSVNEEKKLLSTCTLRMFNASAV